MDRPQVRRHAPLLPLAAGFVAGDLAAWLMPGAIIYGVALLAALSVTALIFRRLTAAATALFTAVGMVAVSVAMPAGVPNDLLDRDVALTGVVGKVSQRGDSQLFLADCNIGGNNLRLRLFYQSAYPALEPGDSVALVARLWLPGTGAVVPGERTSRKQAFADGFSAEGTVRSGTLSVIGYKGGISATLSKWRTEVSEFIRYRLGLDPEAAAMLDAVVMGNSSALPDGVRNRFAASGTAHALALSGMHVAVIVLFISLLMIPMRMATGGRNRLSVVLTVLLLFGYAFLTGCSPSVMRSVLMATAVMAAITLRRASDPLNNLCAAALVILLFSPGAVFNVGFQLSFAAVASIVLFVPEFLPRRSRFPGYSGVMLWLTVCLAAVAGTAMPGAWYFHQLPLCFLPANAVVSLLLPWFMGGGLLLMLASAIGLPSAWLAAGVDGLYSAMAWVTAKVASLPGGAVGDVYFSAWLMLPYYAALWCVWMALRRGRRVWWLCAATLMAFTGSLFMMGDGVTAVGSEAYSVRSSHGTVLLIRHGSHCRVLTDIPPKFQPEEREKLESRLEVWMGRRGIDRLDFVSAADSALWVDGVFYADANRWVAGDVRIELLGNGDAGNLMPHARYLLVSRGYKGDITDDARKLQPDTVVLSRSLYHTRCDTLAARLASAGIPFRRGLDGVALMK